MKNRQRVAFVVVIAVATVACQRRDGPSPADLGSEVRDSAGIQIIENPRPPDRSRLPWRIGPKPRIAAWINGHLDDGTYFARDATKLPDGRIVVVHREGYLSVLEASGAPGSFWNGRYDILYGEDTGETDQMISPYGVAPWPGDSIIVWERIREGIREPGSHGISVFDLQGDNGRHFTLSGGERNPWPTDATSDGSILAVSTTDHEDSAAVQLWDSEGELRRWLRRVPAVEWYNPDGNSWFWHSKTFGREPVQAPWGDLVVVGNTSRYELGAFSVDGTLVRIVRRDHVLRPTTPADVEAHIEREVGAGAWGSRAELRQRLQSVPVGDHLPTFGRVLSDAAGHLWVQEFQAPREEPAPPLWTVFDREGRVLGFVETPAKLMIFEIGEDYILGTAHDEFGWEHVQIWPLKRSRTPWHGIRLRTE